MKTLTSHNGPLLQVTLTAWEVTVLQAMVELGAIPLDVKAFQQWLDDARRICDLYNALLS